MAFERDEPFGGLHDEFMAGQVCAVVANVHRDAEKRKDPFSAGDFMPAIGRLKGDSTPILLDDPKRQGRLVLGSLFPGALKAHDERQLQRGNPGA